MTTLLPVPKAYFTEADGTPLEGGKVEFFEAGTSTPKDTFTDFGGLTANANPVILDSNGEADIWLGDGRYKVVLKTSADVTRWTVDDVSNEGAAGEVIRTVNSIADLRLLDEGVSSIVEVLGYYAPPDPVKGGAVNTNQADAGGGLFYWDSGSSDADNNGTIIKPAVSTGGRWVRVFDGDVSVKWFGARGDYLLDNGAKNGSATDDRTAVNEALAYARTNDLQVRVPQGTYLLSNFLTCAVPIYGDYKPRLSTNLIYGNTGWTTASGFEGSFFVWDKSTLTTSDVYIRNDSGDSVENVTFKNLGFLSLSDGGGTEGGGTLLVNTTPAAAAKYDFGNLPPFDSCMVLNFTLGIKTETFLQCSYNNIEFRGCQRALLLGINATDISKNIAFNGCIFKNCGDGSTSYIQIEEAENIFFNQCLFDTTSEISVREVNNGGVFFNNCFYQNQKGGSGVGAGTFPFIFGQPDAGSILRLLNMQGCQSGTDGGDLDLDALITNPALTLIDCDLSGSDIDAGDGTVTKYGSTNTGTVTTSVPESQVNFSPGNVQFEGFKFAFSGDNRDIKLINTDDDGRVRIAPTDSLSTTDGSLIEMKANLDSGGAADLDLIAGTGSNPGDITLKANPGQRVHVEDADLDVDGALNADGVTTLNNTEINITASTTQTQGQQPLTKNWNEIRTVVNANDVVTLPSAIPGFICGTHNSGANTLQIFPASGDRINIAAVDASALVAAGGDLILVASDADRWWSFST